MSVKLQLLRNGSGSIKSNLQEAKEMIKSLASEHNYDGEPIICRYLDSEEKVVALLGIVNYVEGSIDSVTFFEGLDSESSETLSGTVQEIINAITTGTGLNEDGTYSADASDTILSGATSLTDADSKLSEAITNLQSEVSTEVADLKSADESLQSAISDETSAREEAVTTLEGAISDETTARENADTALQDQITALQSSSTDLQSAIEAEATTRENADNDLQSQINEKVSSVTLSQESSLLYTLDVDGTSYTINIPEDQFLNSASYDTTTHEIVLQFRLSTGDNAMEEIRVDVSDLVDTYTAGNGLSVSNNQFSVVVNGSSESYLTVSSSGLLLSGIDDAISSAVSAGATTVAKDSSASHLTLSTSTASNGATTYTIGESDIASATDLTSEITRATGVEDTLQSSIDSLTTTVNTKANASDLTDEISRATAAETTLQDSINTLSATVDTKASASDLTDEISRATAAESALQDSINSLSSTVTDLDVTDSAAEASFVAYVTQTDGKISATKGTISTDDSLEITNTNGSVDGNITIAVAVIDCGTYDD